MKNSKNTNEWLRNEIGAAVLVATILLIIIANMLMSTLISYSELNSKSERDLESLRMIKEVSKQQDLRLKEIEKELQVKAKVIGDVEQTIDQYSEALVKIEDNAKIKKEEKLAKEKLKHANTLVNQPTRGLIGTGRVMDFKATAYDLSRTSNGNWKGHPYYGLTADGTNVIGKTREQAMVVAADKSILPLGTQVKLTFKGEYSKFNGIYTVRDTGGAVKGNVVDIYMGDFDMEDEHPSVPAFGRVDVKLEIMSKR